MWFNCGLTKIYRTKNMRNYIIFLNIVFNICVFISIYIYIFWSAKPHKLVHHFYGLFRILYYHNALKVATRIDFLEIIFIILLTNLLLMFVYVQPSPNNIHPKSMFATFARRRRRKPNVDLDKEIVLIVYDCFAESNTQKMLCIP